MADQLYSLILRSLDETFMLWQADIETTAGREYIAREIASNIKKKWIVIDPKDMTQV